MTKCIKYILVKSCIIKIYFTYIWHILDIYFNDAEIYFRGQKLYISHIYLISMGVRYTLFFHIINETFLYTSIFV